MTYRETLAEHKKIVNELENAKDAKKIKELNKRLDHLKDLMRSF